MAKGQGKVKKADNTPVPKKSTKSKPLDCTSDKHPTGTQLHAKCVECDCIIGNDTRALNCERWEKNWKCNGCVGIRPNTYDDLISEAGNELQWFCDQCYDIILNPLRDDKVSKILTKLTQQLSQIEVKLDAKADATKVTVLEVVVKEIETRVRDGYAGVIKTLEKTHRMLLQYWNSPSLTSPLYKAVLIGF